MSSLNFFYFLGAVKIFLFSFAIGKVISAPLMPKHLGKLAKLRIMLKGMPQFLKEKLKSSQKNGRKEINF